MSVLSSLYIGSSGLTATGDAIGIVGDNIANASTIGFKGSRAKFEDVLGGNSANGQRVGAGVRLAGAETLFGQGALLNTGRSLDLAVRGEGFFIVKGAHDGIDGQYYTRDGQFHLDDTGFMVNSEGLRLQAYSIDAQGNISSAPGDLAVGPQLPPSPTTEATIFANLNPSDPAVPPFDPANPTTTSQLPTSITVFDSLGASHRVDVYFRNNGAGSWEWHALVDGGELTGGTPGTATEIASGSLTFNTDGQLDTEVTNASSANFLNATPGQVINFDFGDSITTDGGTGIAGTTQFDTGASIVNSQDQDGFAAGSLIDVEVSEDGTINGRFNNGQSRPIGRIALADFTNESGLLRAGSQLFRETEGSGSALIDEAAKGTRGSISSGALEASNVNLSDELVTLIAYQRAFQSNAKIITTADEMLSEIANLKR